MFGRALGNHLGAKHAKKYGFWLPFGSSFGAQNGPKPPRAAFEIVEKTVSFYCISGTGGVQEAARGASKNWPKTEPEKEAPDSWRCGCSGQFWGRPAGYAGPAEGYGEELPRSWQVNGRKMATLI